MVMFPIGFLAAKRLLSQNLSSMLNHAMYQHWIPGFDFRLFRNFNHLMFTDDLILVPRASRLVAKSCRLCLAMYKDLTGQTTNLSKSTIHLPSLIDKKVCKAIIGILGMKVGSYSFKYLGCLIGPKRVFVLLLYIRCVESLMQ